MDIRSVTDADNTSVLDVAETIAQSRAKNLEKHQTSVCILEAIIQQTSRAVVSTKTFWRKGMPTHKNFTGTDLDHR